nr:hypothetical protein CFP56_58131 [Quercus suber]
MSTTIRPQRQPIVLSRQSFAWPNSRDLQSLGQKEAINSEAVRDVELVAVAGYHAVPHIHHQISIDARGVRGVTANHLGLGAGASRMTGYVSTTSLNLRYLALHNLRFHKSCGYEAHDGNFSDISQHCNVLFSFACSIGFIVHQ